MRYCANYEIKHVGYKVSKIEYGYIQISKRRFSVWHSDDSCPVATRG